MTEGVRPNSETPRCLAVLTVRNEAAFLLEWLAHHLAVGFNRFLVFTNDCDDGTDEMLDHLQATGWLAHVRNDGPYHKRGIQFTALKSAQSHPFVKTADWILPLDIDEFVNIKTGDHRLKDLFHALPDATAITLTWRLFGNAGVVRYQDSSILETFTTCAPEIMAWPWRAFMFKTLYRNDGSYRALGVHRPRQPDTDKVAQTRWFDGQGRALGPAFRTNRIFSNFGRTNYGLVQLNHYPLGAMESFVLKSDRGRAVHGSERLGMDYWVERNFNTVADQSISALASARQEILQKLLADETLADLHIKAVQWRKARFESLMREEVNRALFTRLLMTPSSRLVTQEDALYIVEHAKRNTDSST